MARVVKTETCWNWTGATMPIRCKRGGYGVIGIGNKTSTTHRVAYALFVGEIPIGAMVLHRCDNRVCVRPDHLYLGDAKHNARDRLDRERGAWGERSGPSKLTTTEIRSAFRLREQRWTQQRIADYLGVTQSAISRILARHTWRRLDVKV